ncbi:MAG: dipeptidase [Ferrovibrio sp.]
MRVTWTDMADRPAHHLHGQVVEITGWPTRIDPEDSDAPLALTEEPACCGGCLPVDPARFVMLAADLPARLTAAPLCVSGILRRRDEDSSWYWEIQPTSIRPAVTNEAVIAPGFTRRGMLAAGLAAGLASWMPAGISRAAPSAAEIDAAREWLTGHTTMDLHSHGGAVTTSRSGNRARPFVPLAEPMRSGRMAVICLAVVADRIATRVEERRIRAVREPEPGEFYAYIHDAFARLHDLVQSQRLGIVTDAKSLRAANASTPAVIVSSEGADFLEGRIERVDEAFERWQLRCLQLTHYRVNELGDIQTEPAVHGGLTDFGAAVIQRCNRLGIVVDVAHGTYDLVKRAATVSDKPLILSHTALNPQPSRYSRTINSDHARLIAATGGVIGVWPPASSFPSLPDLADGMARMVDVVGVDHVGLGTDMLGLISPAILNSYEQLPDLAAALLARGFSKDETLKLLGGNLERVFLACLP